jgi:hypothetical protein
MPPDDTFPNHSQQSEYTGIPWDQLPKDGFPGMDETPVSTEGEQ